MNIRTSIGQWNLHLCSRDRDVSNIKIYIYVYVICKYKEREEENKFLKIYKYIEIVKKVNSCVQ